MAHGMGFHILALVLSLAALAAGPLLFLLGRRFEALIWLLRGLVLVAIGVLVLAVLIPHYLSTRYDLDGCGPQD